jgi:hypothetical protein
MPEMDPYAVLGVPRTASREEIARAYRRLAKANHPDVNVAPSATMVRINEAWSVLGSPSRRARWDADHFVVHLAHWDAPLSHPTSPAPSRPRTSTRPSPPPPEAPPSFRDSPWFAIGAVAAATGLIVAVMVVVAVVASSMPPSDEPFGGSSRSFTGGDLSFSYPEGWRLYPGQDEPVERAGHAVIAHLATNEVAPDERCLTFDQPCGLTASSLPTGAISIVVTEWRGEDPPLAVLEGAREVDGRPSAYRADRFRQGARFVWQVSPPDFPERWFEIRADAGGSAEWQNEADDIVEEIVGTIRFDS